VRGPKYLVGNPSVHPIDHVPPGVGMSFATTEAAQTYVRREFASATAYWQAEIVNDNGAVIMRGFRNGYNATGRTWTWRTA
jgi:hypothetical protein